MPTRPQVSPLGLLRCAAAIALLGMFLPQALIGATELIAALAQLRLSSPLPMNGWPDAVRQAIINQTEARVLIPQIAAWGPGAIVVLVMALLLRGSPRPVRWFRRMT